MYYRQFCLALATGEIVSGNQALCPESNQSKRSLPGGARFSWPEHNDLLRRFGLCLFLKVKVVCLIIDPTHSRHFACFLGRFPSLQSRQSVPFLI